MIGDPDQRRESDYYAGAIPNGVPVATIRDLSRIDMIRSTAAIASEWASIVIAIALHQRFTSPLFLPLLVIWIGARQHALGILVHEGAHYHLFRNRKVNEAVTEMMLAWPLFITVRAYRVDHFAHHRYLNTDKDPDFVRKHGPEWKFPTTWAALGRLLLKDVFGLNAYQQIAEVAALAAPTVASPARWPLYPIARTAYYVAILAVVTYFRVWPIFILLWIVPLLTWFKLVMRVRSIAEHYSVENDHVYTKTRTTLPSIFDTLFVAPRNINYHIEHHLYPSVPFHRLPRLHALLMNDREFRSKAHLTRRYWRVMRECVGGQKP